MAMMRNNVVMLFVLDLLGSPVELDITADQEQLQASLHSQT